MRIWTAAAGAAGEMLDQYTSLLNTNEAAVSLGAAFRATCAGIIAKASRITLLLDKESGRETVRAGVYVCADASTGYVGGLVKSAGYASALDVRRMLAAALLDADHVWGLDAVRLEAGIRVYERPVLWHGRLVTFNHASHRVFVDLGFESAGGRRQPADDSFEQELIQATCGADGQFESISMVSTPRTRAAATRLLAPACPA